MGWWDPRFTTTDPVIADIFDGQSLNRYAYVNGNPLAFVDPTGFAQNEVEPGDTETYSDPPPALVNHLIFSESVVPRLQNNLAPPTANRGAANVGAYVPPVDVNTTGNGGEGFPKETAEGQPLPAPTVTDGIGDGLGDAARGIWNDWTTPIWEPASDIYDAYRHGDVVDAFNVVNPLIPVANLSLAIDDGDTYSVTRHSVAIGVTVVGAVIVGKLAAGQASGGKTTRGPPKGTKRPGTRGHFDHQADVKGGGNRQAEQLKRPGEKVEMEKPVRAFVGQRTIKSSERTIGRGLSWNRNDGLEASIIRLG